MDFPILDMPMILVFGFAFAMCVESGARALHPDRPFAYEVRAMPILYAAAIGFIALNFYMLVLPYFRPYAYADDWAFTVPLDFKSLSDWTTWLFAQHVDHRIPIQKLVGYVVLRASGFDFRYFVGLNYAMAIAVSAMLLYMAKAYRGYLSAGDMIIPLAALHFSVGYSLWGFQFQFISSIFFFAAFLFFQMRRSTFLATIALIACALCGMNGLLFATCGTVAMIAWLLSTRSSKQTVGFIVALVIELIIWKAWKPSAASGTSGANIREVGVYLFGLLPSSMGVFSFSSVGWKFAVVALLGLAGLAVILLKLRKRELTLNDYLMAVGAAASFIVMLSVAVGRSKAQGEWNSVIGMHYGSMSLFLPALTWLIVSKRFPRAGAVVGVFLLGVFLAAFVVNAQWRSGVIDSSNAHQQEIVAAMKAGTPAEDLAKKYFTDFNWLDDATHRAAVIDGINAVRSVGAPLYGGR